MKRFKITILITIGLLLIVPALIKTNSSVKEEVNNNKIEIRSNADYVEFIDDELYIYLSVNFDFDKFKIEALVNNKKVSNYPLLKMVQDVDPFIPSEYIKMIDLENHSQNVHIIVR